MAEQKRSADESLDSGRSKIPATGNEQADPNAPMTIRALIAPKDAGTIIGRAGATIQEIRDKSGCRVQLSVHVDPPQDRILTVVGTQTGIFTAFNLVGTKITEATPGLESVTMKLAIPHSQAGAVIGRAGAKIKEIRETSGSNVVFEKEVLPGSTERCCTITGAVASASNAVFMIVGVLALPSSQSRVPTVPFTPGAAIPSSFPGFVQQPGGYPPGNQMFGGPGGFSGGPPGGFQGGYGGPSNSNILKSHSPVIFFFRSLPRLPSPPHNLRYTYRDI